MLVSSLGESSCHIGAHGRAVFFKSLRPVRPHIFCAYLTVSFALQSGREIMRCPIVLAASCALLVTVMAAREAQAQGAYPTKSIRFIVPVTTGGPSDIVARLLSDKLAASFGKPVIVDNRPGASNTVGAAIVAKAE